MVYRDFKSLVTREGALLDTIGDNINFKSVKVRNDRSAGTSLHAICHVTVTPQTDCVSCCSYNRSMAKRHLADNEAEESPSVMLAMTNQAEIPPIGYSSLPMQADQHLPVSTNLRIMAEEEVIPGSKLFGCQARSLMVSQLTRPTFWPQFDGPFSWWVGRGGCLRMGDRKSQKPVSKPSLARTR